MTPTLFSEKYGVLTMAPGTMCSNQWMNLYGVRYGTFLDKQGLFVALRLSEVQVIV